MKYIKKRKLLCLCGAALCLLMTGCAKMSDIPSVEDYKTKIESSGAAEINGQGGREQEDQEGGDDNKNNGNTDKAGIGERNADSAERKAEGPDEARQIPEQTFQVTLKPLGEVTFASYEPDTEKNPLADAVFVLFRDNDILSILPGVYEDNIRTNECFTGVEAVSFPDYNNDGYEDILIICSYSPASGPNVGTGYPEVRIFRGSKDGGFLPETELSAAANAALAELTVKSVLGFLGADRKTPQEESFWQQAYIDYVLQQNPEVWEGYDLIYLDGDDVPELVQVGNSAAAGTKIINFYNGSINETQLDRTFFTYIEKENLLCNSDGNMDSYYDLVYSLEDGRMRLIAEGHYMAGDNANLKLDEGGRPIYQYQWNGAAATQKEYDKALGEIFDKSRAAAPDKLYSAEELMKLCNSTE